MSKKKIIVLIVVIAAVSMALFACGYVLGRQNDRYVQRREIYRQISEFLKTDEQFCSEYGAPVKFQAADRYALTETEEKTYNAECRIKNDCGDVYYVTVKVDMTGKNGDGIVYSVLYVYGDEVTDAKPVIYLYPKEKTVCSVRLSYDGKITASYPEYGADGWADFTAYPDGTLEFGDGRRYYALFWEGNRNAGYDFSKGFCVKGSDTAEFLYGALKKAGLNDREADEFIIYWLPRMQNNEYNLISFQTAAYTDGAELQVTPAPDTVIRVFMAYKPLGSYVRIEEQELSAPARDGFTVVEWGGCEVR